jgi:adenylate cyclase class IV
LLRLISGVVSFRRRRPAVAPSATAIEIRRARLASSGYDAPTMPANVEIKARLRHPARVRRFLEEATGGPPQVLDQEDTFFPVAAGRLKLRVLGHRRGELIAYRRSDAAGPKVSEYLVVPTTEPALLRDALAAALGVRGTVRKTRLLFLVGTTRVHLDTVERLGEFLELEVVLRAGQSVAEGEGVARDLMAWLGIEEGDLLEEAYIDMIEGAGSG